MFRSSTITLRASGSAALNGSAPAGVAVDDLLVAFVVLDGVTGDTITPPANWTSRGSFGFLASVPDGSKVEVFTKRVVGGESYAFTTSVTNDAVMTIGCWTNIDWSTSPIPGLRSAVVSTTNTTANATPVSVNATGGTAVAGDDIAWFGMLDITVGTDTWGFTPPTNFTERQDGQQGFAIATLATRDLVPVGATGTLTATGTRSAGTGAAGWGTFVLFIATLPAPSPAGLDLVRMGGWRPQRWDFPLEVDLLLDDFLPSAGGGGVQNLTYTAQGGFTISGAGTLVRGIVRTSAGGLTFSGTGAARRGLTRTASGGLTFGGAGTTAVGRGWNPSGGLVFNGAATVVRGRVLTSAGGFTFAGAAAVARGIIRAATGGITFGGAASFGTGKTWTPSGGFTMSGAATVLRGLVRTGTGGLTFGGAGTVARGIVRTASGGLTFGGAATALRGHVLTAAGGLTFSGAAAILKQKLHTATGGIIFGGSAPMQGNTAGGGGGGTPDERVRHWTIKSILPGGR